MSGEEQFDKLVSELNSGDLIKAVLAAHRLSDLKDERAIPHLICAIMGGNSMLHTDAARALGTFGKPAIAMLAEILEDHDARAAHEAAKALVEIGNRESLPALCKIALGNWDPAIRIPATHVLGEIRDISAVPTLFAIMDLEREREGRPAITMRDVELGEQSQTALNSLTLIANDHPYELAAYLGKAETSFENKKSILPLLGTYCRKAPKELLGCLANNDKGFKLIAANSILAIADPSSLDSMLELFEAHKEGKERDDLRLLNVSAHFVGRIKGLQAFSYFAGHLDKPGCTFKNSILAGISEFDPSPSDLRPLQREITRLLSVDGEGREGARRDAWDMERIYSKWLSRLKLKCNLEHTGLQEPPRRFRTPPKALRRHNFAEQRKLAIGGAGR
ncbi:HEAT repeat domain-containing protein [Candidatus Micrarchaeota archaeon]|nr:HEAT repeat domain-containing protein [Candidatus Micrarchaeota archaeon]